MISFFIYFSYFVNAIACISFGIIGDCWKFDSLLIIATFLDVVCFGIEANAVNIWMLGIAYTIGAQPFEVITSHG